MDILIKASQLIASLSILIVLHEMGHFLPARLFNTRVEKFYLFFDPWFSIFKIKKGDTVYGIGWLPLGGYVKISGMIDESMDKDAMKEEPKPYEFRAKPAWQRLIIMIGGVTVNIILGFLIFAMVLFVWGKQRLPIENMTYGIQVDSVLQEHGLQNGDKILSIGDNSEIKFQDEISKAIVINGERKIKVDRNGEEVNIELPSDIDQILLKNEVKRMISPRIPFIVDSVIADGGADKAGLLKGDSIIAINGDSLFYVGDVMEAIVEHKEEEISMTFARGDEVMTLAVETDENGKINVGPKGYDQLLEMETQEYSFFESIPAGFTEMTTTLTGYVSSLKLIFTKEGAKQIGGFGAIGSLFPPKWVWSDFWRLTAFLSIILAFMNILPIPALDGGHVMFLMYEIVSGRKPSEKFLEYAQYAGMILLLGLLVYANGNDLFKAFSN